MCILDLRPPSNRAEAPPRGTWRWREGRMRSPYMRHRRESSRASRRWRREIARERGPNLGRPKSESRRLRASGWCLADGRSLAQQAFREAAGRIAARRRRAPPERLVSSTS